MVSLDTRRRKLLTLEDIFSELKRKLTIKIQGKYGVNRGGGSTKKNSGQNYAGKKINKRKNQPGCLLSHLRHICTNLENVM